MIDPGHPFTAKFADLIASLEDSVRLGVEQPDVATFIFKRTISSYELPRTALMIERVSGLVAGRPAQFDPGQDFTFASNRVVWRGGGAARRPDDGTPFDVDYTWREMPSGLTDFNPGSVVGTLLRAVARELTLLYAQVDEAYRRGFLDVATGAALDNVVALLGLERTSALRAGGFVTFFRKSAPAARLVIPAGTRVADASGRSYRTTGEVALAADAIDEVATPVGATVQAQHRVARLVGVWPRDADPAGAGLATVDTARGKPFGGDERTITLAAAPAGSLHLRYVARSVRAPVEAVDPGPQGDAAAGTLVVMPTPPRGIDGVTNEAPIVGGHVAQSDEQLRERARHALESAGKSTLDAIKFAVLDVPGVQGVVVLDHSVDESIALGEVRVRYATTGNPEQLARIAAAVAGAVERTRAAGIYARVESVEAVPISGVLYVVPDTTPVVGAAAALRDAVIAALRGLAIGEALSLRKLRALVYRVPGLAEVAEAQLQYPDDPAAPAHRAAVTDPLLVRPMQQVRPDEPNLRVTVLRALDVRGVSDAGGGRAIQLGLLPEGSAEPVPFQQLALDVAVTVKAKLLRAPDQPPERVASFVRTLTFAPTATLLLAASDVPGFRAADHDPHGAELVVAAAAHAGLGAASTTIEVPR